jgi:hypothetical protein
MLAKQYKVICAGKSTDKYAQDILIFRAIDNTPSRPSLSQALNAVELVPRTPLTLYLDLFDLEPSPKIRYIVVQRRGIRPILWSSIHPYNRRLQAIDRWSKEALLAFLSDFFDESLWISIRGIRTS